MFGYITTNEGELKVKDFNKYKGFYCGLCRSLQKQHGRRGQATLSYDLTFFCLLHTGLYEPETVEYYKRCGFHVFQKTLCIQNKFSDYAADMNLLLTYDKLLDDWEDEKKVTRLAGAKALASRYRRIETRYPEKCAFIQEKMKAIKECEQRGEQNPDIASGLFGDIFGEMFVYRKDEWEDVLRRCGFFFGKFIYLMDAYEDLEKDKETGNYNPLLFISTSPDYEERCKQILTMMMAECAREFEKLPIVENIDILRNILYSGVWTRYELIQQKRKEPAK